MAEIRKKSKPKPLAPSPSPVSSPPRRYQNPHQRGSRPPHHHRHQPLAQYNTTLPRKVRAHPSTPQTGCTWPSSAGSPEPRLQPALPIPLPFGHTGSTRVPPALPIPQLATPGRAGNPISIASTQFPVTFPSNKPARTGNISFEEIRTRVPGLGEAGPSRAPAPLPQTRVSINLAAPPRKGVDGEGDTKMRDAPAQPVQRPYKC